jgi:hypothetical protein
MSAQAVFTSHPLCPYGWSWAKFGQRWSMLGHRPRTGPLGEANPCNSSAAALLWFAVVASRKDWQCCRSSTR